VKFFYLVAHHCYELNNIHTCTSIFGGMQLEAISRLRRVTSFIQDDQQIKSFHDFFVELTSTDRNYKVYRDIQESWFTQNTIRPCIPFIPVMVKDLYQVQFQMTPKNENNQKCVDLNLLEKKLSSDTSRV